MAAATSVVRINARVEGRSATTTQNPVWLPARSQGNQQHVLTLAWAQKADPRLPILRANDDKRLARQRLWQKIGCLYGADNTVAPTRSMTCPP